MAYSIDLSGHRVLITGASSGLGEHFAQTFAAAGAEVVLAARRRDKLESLVAALHVAGHRAHAVSLDVSDAASVQAAFDSIDADIGVCDIIVNNAGVGLGRAALENTEADWDAVMDTNLKGSWRVATEGARRLVKAGRGGSIVNIASILGERVGGANSLYCTSKAGLIQLTKALALDLARYGIRVNALAPGYVVTDLNRDFLASASGQKLMQRIPQRRFGTADELDGALLLLASDAGSYITGAMLAADGGHLVSGL